VNYEEGSLDIVFIDKGLEQNNIFDVILRKSIKLFVWIEYNSLVQEDAFYAAEVRLQLYHEVNCMVNGNV